MSQNILKAGKAEEEKSKIPEKLRSLFWDVELENINLEQHADYVLERVLDFGTLDAVRWLRSIYSDERIAEFIKHKSFRLRSLKTVNFWRIILDISPAEWNNPSSRVPS